MQVPATWLQLLLSGQSLSKRHSAQPPFTRLQTGAAGAGQWLLSRQGTHLLLEQKGFAASVQSASLVQPTPQSGGTQLLLQVPAS